MPPESVLGLVGPAPPPMGGMATQTRQLKRFLEQEGLTVAFVATNASYKPAVVAKIPVLRAIFRLLPYLLSVFKLARSSNVIHLMANSGWSWQLFSAPVIWLGRITGTPVIVNYRGGEAKAYFSSSIRWVAPSMKRAAQIVVPSRYLQEIFQSFGFSAHVIPNIIDLDKFSPRPDTALPNTPNLVVARNLEPIYGIDTAIRAMEIICKHHPDATLQIAGSGPQRQELQTLVASLGLSNNVAFVGRLDTESMVEFYHQATLMLNPTTVDNMPNSVLEALACKVPVVSTNVGGVPFIVTHEHTALLVNPGDHLSMAEQSLRILEQPDLARRLMEQGHAQVQQYGWNKVRDLWLKLYSEQGLGL